MRRSEAGRARTNINPRRKNAVDRATEAYTELRGLIVEGRLAPGFLLSENDVATRLQLSRTPVRAALQRLQQQGFLKLVPIGNSLRPVVSPLTAEDLTELFHIAGALEGLAARLAATLPERRRMALLSTMELIHGRLQAAAQTQPPSIRDAGEQHVRFHRTYVDAAAGPRLKDQLDSIQPQVERYERMYTSVLIGEFSSSMREHEAIIEAFRSGDPDRAEAAVVSNWRNGAERYLGVVRTLGDRGAW